MKFAKVRCFVVTLCQNFQIDAAQPVSFGGWGFAGVGGMDLKNSHK